MLGGVDLEFVSKVPGREKQTFTPFMWTVFPAEGCKVVKVYGKNESSLSTTSLDCQSLVSLITVFTFWIVSW